MVLEPFFNLVFHPAIRGVIHCHVLSKSKSDPALCNLAFKALLAKKIREELMERDNPMSDEQRDILQDGLQAGKIICNYYDSLVS